jgi:hypothetical protein
MWVFVLGETTGARLPARVRETIEVQQHRS